MIGNYSFLQRLNTPTYAWMTLNLCQVLIQLYTITVTSFVSEIQVKKKWKYLRDQFAIELKKETPGRSDNAAQDKTESKWQYFHSLLFLRDISQPRPPLGNLSDRAKEALHTNDEEVTMDPPPVDKESTGLHFLGMRHQSSVTEENMHIEKSMPSTCASFSKKRHSNKYQKMQHYNNSILDIERQKIQYLLKKSSHKPYKDEDDNLLLFKSLLPLVATIPITQKLAFRGRIQDVVQQFAFPDVSPQISNISSPEMSPLTSAASNMNLITGGENHSFAQHQVRTTSNNLP